MNTVLHLPRAQVHFCSIQMKNSKGTSNVDPNEISHFTTLSKHWWDALGSMRCLHAMNHIRVPLIRDELTAAGAVKGEFNDGQPLKGLLVLEVGCGGGILTEALAKLGCTIVGLDLSSELLEIAKAHAALDPSLTNLRYVLESVEDHSLNNFEKYDAVIASEVVEHVPDKDAFLEHCVKCLKPGGSIFVTTFNRTLASWLIGIICYESIFGAIPRGTHSWDKFVPPEETADILSKYHCSTKAVHGTLYNCITNRWSWSWFTTVTYALHSIKC